MVGDVYFVYLDWTLELKPRVFYVGKGSSERVGRKDRDNVHWKNVVSKHGHSRQVLLGTLDEQFAFEEERRLIREHKTFYGHADYVWGVNKTEGGEGSAGHTWSEEARLRKSLATRGIPHSSSHSARIGLAMKGNTNGSCVQHDAEAREKIAVKLRGTKKTVRKLTWQLVLEIRTSDESSTELARKHGLARQTINAVRRHRTWKGSPPI